jgi:PAS domain S-box-containing protein
MIRRAVQSPTEVMVDLNEKKSIRVLHVDDEPGLLKIAKQLLETEGQFQVDTASTAEEAREKMKKETYDAVVSDYQMSGKDGLELLKDLRQNGSTVPFIIFTGKGREEVAIKALNLGADRYLDKNGDPETVYCELAHAINEAVERKRAQEKLRESEERFRLLFDNMAVGVVLIDRDGFVVAANQAQCSFLGYAKGELIGMHFSRYLSEDDLERGLFLLREMVEGKRDNYTADRKYKRKDSVLVWGRSSWSAVRNEEGQFKYLVAVVEDITESKKAQLALSESEEKFRSVVDSAAQEELRDLREKLDVLFEHAPDAYYMNDLKGVFVAGNRAAEKMTGYGRNELIGKSFLKLNLLPRNQIPKAARLLAMNALGRSTGPDEFMLNRNDGTQVQVEIRTFPAKLDGRTLVLGIARDVTRRKKDERTVLESKQKFEGLFTGNPEATVYLDQNFRILDVNPRFTSLFGYSLEEVRGKVLNDVVVPKSCMEEAKMLDGKAGEGYVYHDTVRVKKDGSLVQVSVSAAPIIIQDQLAGYIGVYKDISKLKKTEEELQKAMENVGIMNEKLRVVGGLTRHDVRNKLSTITGNTYLARKELAGNSKVSDYLKEMETAVRQVVRIFDFAKTYEMLGVEGLAYIDVERTINEATSLFSDMKSAKVLNECHGLTVLADSLLRQLFYNLMDNSLKYGKKITKIRIHYEKTGENNLRLIYEDDGVGIPDSEKPKLFKEGFSSGGSTGYGLYLIKKMVEFYGWTIQETGITGKGARFTITIPKKNQNGNENYQLT